MTDKIQHIAKAVVLSNQKVSAKTWKVSFFAPGITQSAGAGQFVHIKISAGTPWPLLRRPFSINDVVRDRMFILYEIKGSGTSKLSLMKPGEEIDLIGPLGRGFEINASRKEHLLVAGGMGIAPMGLLARRLKSQGSKHELLYGCRNATELLPHPKSSCVISSDDGSCGEKGLVTSLLEKRLKHCKNPAVYACGPWPMLKAVADICRRENIPCQVSLESFMACGVGACQGCVVKGSDGSYLSVCDKGPVFDSQQIDWEQQCTI